MQSAGSAKDILRRAHSWRQLAEHFRIEERSSVGRAQPSTPELRNGSFPAHTTGRSRGKSTSRATRRETHTGIESYAHEIPLWGFIICHPQANPVLSSGDDALGE